MYSPANSTRCSASMVLRSTRRIFAVAREIADLERLRRDLGGDRPAGDALSRRQVALHQQRRHGQHVADVVEAVAGVVGGEILARRGTARRAGRESCWCTRCDSAGAPSCVPDPASPTHRRARRRARCSRSSRRAAPERSRRAGRRHVAGAKTPQDRFPGVALLDERLGRRRAPRRSCRPQDAAVVALGARLRRAPGARRCRSRRAWPLIARGQPEHQARRPDGRADQRQRCGAGSAAAPPRAGTAAAAAR